MSIEGIWADKTFVVVWQVLAEFWAVATWLELVARYEVKGKQTHDARLVAAMIAVGITEILTLNPHDFARYREITAISP